MITNWSKTRITLIVIVSLIILATGLHVQSQHKMSGYVEFNIEFYDSMGRPYRGLLGAPAIPPGVEVYAQVYALAPPGSAEPVVEVYRGKLDEATLRIGAKGPLGSVAGSWFGFESIQAGKPGYGEAGLELNLWVVDTSSGGVLQRVSYFYSYSPAGMLGGEGRKYTVRVAIPDRVKDTGLGAVYSSQCATIREWRLNYSITPDMAPSAFGSGNAKYSGGAWYVKVPVLTVYNKYTTGPSLMDGAIGFTFEKKTEFKAAIGIGAGIAKRLKGGDITGGLDGEVYLGGPTRSVIVDSFWDPEGIGDGEWFHVWIWARPVMLYYNEYVIVMCPESGFYREYYTGTNKVELLVQDVIVEYKGRIGGRDVYLLSGDISYSPPPSYITGWLFNSTLTLSRYMDSYRPGEGHNFFFIIPGSIDTCSADFEVSLGIPLSVVLAAAGKPELIPLAVMMAPSLSYGESETIYVSGGLYNSGSHAEHIYMRVSQLQFKKDPPWWEFWEDTCYYRVPVSMYFESR